MAMRSRWISLVPPPKVRISAPWNDPLEPAGQRSAGRVRRQAGGLAEDLGQQPVGLGEELGAEHLRWSWRRPG